MWKPLSFCCFILLYVSGKIRRLLWKHLLHARNLYVRALLLHLTSNLFHEKGRLAGLWFCFHGIGLFIKHCKLYANVAFEHNTSLNVEPGTSKKLYNTTTKTVNGKKVTETVNRHIHVSNSAKDIGGHSSNFEFWTYLD